VSVRDRPSAEVALVLLLCAVALVFAAPILPHLHDWGVLDWDQHLFHHAVPRATILDYHELPLWNPYNWSGVPLLANPESRVLAPTFPLILLFGEVVGLKLELLVHLVIGMLGAFHLLRHRGVGRPGSLAAAFVFMLNSWYALHMTVGHTWALNVAYLPWAFLFYLKALENVRYASAASIVLAFILFGGGIYLVIMAAMLFWFYAAASCAISPRETRRHARALAAISVQTVLLTAVKVLPAIELMFEHPRRTGVHTGYTVTALLNALFARSQTLSSAYAERPEEFYAWLHEGMYVGLIALVPFLIGASGKPRQRAPLLVVLLLFLWIALGDHVPLSLWSGLHALPVFDNLRMTQRFGICAVLIFAILVGHGIDSVQTRMQSWTSTDTGTAAAWALTLLVLADLMLVNSPIFGEAFPIAPMEVRRNSDFQQILRWRGYDANGWRTRHSNPQSATLSGLYPAFLSNRGSTRGYKVVPVPSHAATVGSKGYRGEIYLDGSSGRVRLAEWSPNRLLIEVSAQGEGVVVVNQNYASGWRVRRHAAEGRRRGEVSQKDGLLAVTVGPSDDELELTYLPTSFVVGALLTATSFATLATAAIRRARRRRLSRE